VRFFDSPRRRWYLLAAAWAVLVTLGIGGFVEQSHAADLGRTWLDNLYLTLQLATLDYDGGDAAINWRLQIARYAAPAMAASTLLQTASVVFRDQFQRWRLRRVSGHTIVLGLGPIGTRLAAALAADGRNVIGVDDPGAAGLADVQGRGIPVIAGDPTDPSTLRDARVARAASVVIAGDDDARNVSVAVRVGAVPFPAGRAPLRCTVHLNELTLTRLLSATAIGGSGGVRTEFFNVHAAAAHSLVDAMPDALRGRDAHLVIVGFGRFGVSTLVAAAQRHQGDDDHAGELRVTIVDPEASGKWQALLLKHPGVDGRASVVCLDVDLDAPTPDVASRFVGALADPRPTLVVIATVDESKALETGLFAYHTIADATVPVVVRTGSDSGLAALISPVGETPPFPGLSIFPFLDRACTTDVVERGIREQIARGVHADYVAHGGLSSTGLHRPWEELTDAERESSRASADAIVSGLTALGYLLVPLARWDQAPPALDPAELDALAAAEHERWRAERLAAGWTYGRERDDVQKHNPLLVQWADLPAAAKQRNREAIELIPAQLARAGVALVR
jgi:voltage-gated potassium channel Kch